MDNLEICDIINMIETEYKNITNSDFKNLIQLYVQEHLLYEQYLEYFLYNPKQDDFLQGNQKCYVIQNYFNCICNDEISAKMYDLFNMSDIEFQTKYGLDEFEKYSVTKESHAKVIRHIDYLIKRYKLNNTYYTQYAILIFMNEYKIAYLKQMAFKHLNKENYQSFNFTSQVKTLFNQNQNFVRPDEYLIISIAAILKKPLVSFCNTIIQVNNALNEYTETSIEKMREINDIKDVTSPEDEFINNIIKTRKYIFIFTCLFGLFGFYRFYKKQIKLGILYFFTCGVYLVGYFYDIYQSYVDIKKVINFKDCPYTISEIDNMSGLDFEAFVVDLMISLGYEAYQTKASNDYGIDVIAKKDNDIYAIQAKRYSGNVGIHSVMEASTGAKYYNANYAVVITNSYFTKQAIDCAEKVGVTLLDRDFLIKKL